MQIEITKCVQLPCTKSHQHKLFPIQKFTNAFYVNIISCHIALWKFVAENYTEKFDALKFTLKDNIKDDSTENHTEIIPLLFRIA